MSLFEGIAEQASEIAKRVRDTRAASGAPIVIAGTKGKSRLLQRVADSLGEDSVIVQVPRDLDKTAYVLLTASAQCGAEPLRETALQLAAHQADPSRALDALDAALGSRALLVDDIDAIEGFATDVELREVFAPSSKKVSDWLQAKAAVVTHASTAGDHVKARVDTPSGDHPWDHQLIWKRAGGDVELYTLAVARTLLLGVPADEPSLAWNAESVVGDLWGGMTEDLRDLISILAVHGRPLPEAHLVPLGLGTKAELALTLGRTSHLLDHARGMVRLTSSSSWLSLLSTSARRAIHQRLAGAFARVAREPDSLTADPLTVLEAHRHYAAIQEVEQAREFASFGVAMLLGSAKRMSMDARQEANLYARSSRTYEVVLTLDQQLREHEDREGVGPQARAYAIHYRAYNRYKAKLGNPSETLSAYREALSVWRENALFWSRTISCCFVADRYEEGFRARDDAFAAVPLHPRRDWYLIARTVEHLLRGDRVLAALLVWRDHRYTTPVELAVESRLLSRLDKGWMAERLWAPGVIPLEFREPVLVRIPGKGRFFTCHLLGLTCPGFSAESALSGAMTMLFDELLGILEDPEPSPAQMSRRQDLLMQIDLDATRPSGEPARWAAYLASLDARIAKDEMTEAQRHRLLEIWQRARSTLPRLRRPVAGCSDEGRLSLSWAFVDVKGITLTVDIERDGRVDWFYRNTQDGQMKGTEDEAEAELPEEAFLLFAAFAS